MRKTIFSDLHAILEQNRILNSKSSKVFQNIEKTIFLKLQLWVSGQYWPIMGRFMASKVRSIPKSYQNVLFHPDSKIDNFIHKNLPPPHTKIEKMGRGIFIKCCLRQKSLNMIKIFWILKNPQISRFSSKCSGFLFSKWDFLAKNWPKTTKNGFLDPENYFYPLLDQLKKNWKFFWSYSVVFNSWDF